jgi:hypothetical protein
VNQRDLIQTIVLVVMFVGGLAIYRRLRDAGAASVDDGRDSPASSSSSSSSSKERRDAPPSPDDPHSR